MVPESSPPTSPCRLFVYLASEAPVGVVLRRGPSDWARLSVWRTDTDTFEHGQWLRGRVYERRCDVSPDGSLFVYFARKSVGRPEPNNPELLDTWVAVSRPPYFTALAIWFVGGTYCAGGCFPTDRSLWVSWTEQPPDDGRLPRWLRLTKAISYLDRTPTWTDRTVHYNRLRRDGWRPGPDSADLTTWERLRPNGTLTLLMIERSDRDFRAYGGPHVVEYAVTDESRREVYPLGRADWADWDRRGRLVVAQHGRLLEWLAPDTLRELADLNGAAPEPAPSPGWAQEWPRRRAMKRTPAAR